MEAQAECGIGDGDDFKAGVELKFKFDRWPHSHGDYIFECMSKNHPLSYDNIMKGK